MKLTKHGIPTCPKDLASLIDTKKLNRIDSVSELRMLVEYTLTDNFPHMLYDNEPPEIIRERVRLVDDTTAYLRKKLRKNNRINDEKIKLNFKISDKKNTLNPAFFKQKNTLDL